MRLESTSLLERDTLATGYSDASLTPSSAPGCERTLVLGSVEDTGWLQSPVTDHARLSTPITQELRVDQPCSSVPRLHSVVARGTNGQPRTYRLASPLVQRMAYRRLALTILGLDVGHLAAELRAARLKLAHAA
jgi:hypothetical protein